MSRAFVLLIFWVGVAALPGRAQTPAQSRAALEKMIAQQPNDLPTRVAYANFLSAEDDRPAARAAWLDAQKLAPGDPAIAQAVGESELGLGNIRPALEAYTRASRAEPQDALHHFSMANVLFVFRRSVPLSEPEAIRQALVHFAAAAQLAPLNEDYARAYAETFYAVPQADWRAATAAWTHVAELAPKKDFAWLNLARVSLRAGDGAQARAWLAKINDPSFRAIRQKLEQQARRAAPPRPTS